MKQLTINQVDKEGKFVTLIICDVEHTESKCLNNGNYNRPDDWDSGSIDSILLEGDEISQELRELGFDFVGACEALEGVKAAEINTDIDLTDFVEFQQESYR